MRNFKERLTPSMKKNIENLKAYAWVIFPFPLMSFMYQVVSVGMADLFVYIIRFFSS